MSDLSTRLAEMDARLDVLKRIQESLRAELEGPLWKRGATFEVILYPCQVCGSRNPRGSRGTLRSLITPSIGMWGTAGLTYAVCANCARIISPAPDYDWATYAKPGATVECTLNVCKACGGLESGNWVGKRFLLDRPSAAGLWYTHPNDGRHPVVCPLCAKVVIPAPERKPKMMVNPCGDTLGEVHENNPSCSEGCFRHHVPCRPASPEEIKAGHRLPEEKKPRRMRPNLSPHPGGDEYHGVEHDERSDCAGMVPCEPVEKPRAPRIEAELGDVVTNAHWGDTRHLVIGRERERYWLRSEATGQRSSATLAELTVVTKRADFAGDGFERIGHGDEGIMRLYENGMIHNRGELTWNELSEVRHLYRRVYVARRKT